MNRSDFTRKHALALATIGLAPLAALGTLSLPAKGADYGPPVPAPPPAYDMVDFASGWYVRGDVAYAQETFPKIAPSFAADPSEPPIILPGTVVNALQSVLNSYSAGAGMGYKVNNWFRTDLVLDYRSEVQAGLIGASVTDPFCITDIIPNPVQGPTFGLPVAAGWANCTPHLNTDIHRWDLLANAYIDIGTWQGFTPYVGAGAGVAWARIKQSANWYQDNGIPYQVSTGGFFFDYDRSLGTMTYNFAWALMAGVSVAVMEHVQVDVGYRYLNLGTLSGTSATGTSVTQRITANEVRVGLRYTID